MKNHVFKFIILGLFICCFSLSACGGSDDTTTQESSDTSQTADTSTTTETQSATTTESTSTSSGSLTWNDMPVYSGASQVQKGSWTIPPTEGDYTKMEWRYYETGDSLDKVSAYYKSQMPKQNWQEMGWMDVQDMHWGMYNKNNENDAAMIWMSFDGDTTIIAMWRATR